MTFKPAWYTGAAILLAALMSPIACKESSKPAPKDNQPAGQSAEAKEGNGASPIRLVSGDPETLIVQESDLPADFGLSRGEHLDERNYAHVYFEPEALLADESAAPRLLGVIINLSLLADATAAGRKFINQGGLDPDSMLDQVRESTPDATPVSADQIDFTVTGADRLLGFRVHYILQGTKMYEYRYRVLVANALGNLIISARATSDGGEPAILRTEADSILKRQVEILNTARG